MQQTNKLNKYEMEILRNLEVENDGFVYKGFDLLVKMATAMGQGNYRLYNMATDGIGKMNPIGNLLAKLGIE